MIPQFNETSKTMQTVKLVLDDSGKEELLNYYNEKLRKIEAERKTVADIIKQLIGPTKDQNQLKIEDQSTQNGFSPKWTASTKIRYALRSFGKCKPTKPIAEKLLKLDPDRYKEYEIARKQVASTVRQKVKAGKDLNRYKSEEGIFQNGLSEWFHLDGTVKEEFK